MAIIDLGGFLGSALISGAFAMQVRGIGGQWQRAFLHANLAGSLLLIPPAIAYQTPAALLLNLFWLCVTTEALAAAWGSKHPKLAARIIQLAAVSTIAAAINNCWQTGGDPFEWAATAAMALFMVGYFSITRNPLNPGTRLLYFATAMAGNALFIPLLYRAGNLPNLSLQAACLAISVCGLATVAGRRGQAA